MMKRPDPTVSELPQRPVPIRSARASDWPAIAALLSESALPLAGAEEHVLAFHVAGFDAVVGCAALEQYGTAALLRSVAVAAEQRGTGIGKVLIEACLSQAMNSGVSTVILLTTTAQAYFARRGFRVIDRTSVPEAVRASAEFRGACPDSATVMRIDFEVGPLDAGAATIRHATVADVPAIVAIYNEGIRERQSTFETRERTTDDVDAWLQAPAPPLYVAELAGTVVGWVRAGLYRPRDCYAGIGDVSIYVAASHRRRGIGERLLRALIDECGGTGYWKLIGRIFPENTASLALCHRLAFRTVGVYESHGILDGLWRDVVIVERAVRAAPGTPAAHACRVTQRVRRTVQSMVDDATAAITTYSVSQARLLHDGGDVQFIDLRDLAELEREGIIPGAFHAPRGLLEFWADPQSPYYKPVFAEDKHLVLFCAAGLRSALATKTLQDMGLQNVAHIDGGFRAWKADGAPVGERVTG